MLPVPSGRWHPSPTTETANGTPILINESTFMEREWFFRDNKAIYQLVGWKSQSREALRSCNFSASTLNRNHLSHLTKGRPGYWKLIHVDSIVPLIPPRFMILHKGSPPNTVLRRMTLNICNSLTAAFRLYYILPPQMYSSMVRDQH